MADLHNELVGLRGVVTKLQLTAEQLRCQMADLEADLRRNNAAEGPARLADHPSLFPA